MSIFAQMFGGLLGGFGNGLSSYYQQQDNYNFQREMQGNQFAQQKDMFGMNSALQLQLQTNSQSYGSQYQKDQFGYNSKLSEQQFQQQASLAAMGYQNQQQLAAMNFGYNQQLSQQGYTQNKDLAYQQFGYNSELSKQTAQQNRDQSTWNAAMAGYTTAASTFGRSARTSSGVTNTPSGLRATSNAAFDNLYANFSRQGKPSTVDGSIQTSQTSSTASGDSGDLINFGNSNEKTITPTKFKDANLVDTSPDLINFPSSTQPDSTKLTPSPSSEPVYRNDDPAPNDDYATKHGLDNESFV